LTVTAEHGLWSLIRTEYAQVTKMLGNGRIEAQCFDGEKRLAHIRGKMRKKVGLMRRAIGKVRRVGSDLVSWVERNRSGSTKETLSFSRFVISRTTRQT
jgi:hypothetical protein